jgi:hypothetical protein
MSSQIFFGISCRKGKISSNGFDDEFLLGKAGSIPTSIPNPTLTEG